MEHTKVNDKKEMSETQLFQKRLKNRFQISDSNLLGNTITPTNLFSKDNSISPDFTVLSVMFERATLREASSFKAYMEEAIAEDKRNIIVDLSECEFIDSSFFGVLVGGVKRMRAVNKKFYVVYNTTNKLPIFSATGLDKVFTVFDTMEEAINS